MKVLLLLLAVVATTLGTARAQNGTIQQANAGSSLGSTPNYKPAPGTKSPAKTGGKPAGASAGKVVVSSGGQGHNSGPDSKGKVMVAPSAFPAKTGKAAAKPSKQ